jgi:hypothetical protein
MSKVIIAIATVVATLPAGIEAGPLRIALLDQAGNVVQAQTLTGVEATFTGIADGEFTATAVRLDSTGANLGDVITQAFTVALVVPPVPATFDAPTGLTISVTPE